MTWLTEYLANNDPRPRQRANDALANAALIRENADPLSRDACPECGEPAVDDLGPDEDGEYDGWDDYDEGDVPHVLVCLNDHEWLEGA